MNQLYHGDCVDIMAGMEADSVDMVLTSPPYDDLRTYNGYRFDFESIAKGLYRITKQGGVVVWVVGDQIKDSDESGTSFRHALYFKEIGFNLFDTMIYAKHAPVITGFKGYYQCFEYMFVLSKGTPETINLLLDRPNKGVYKSRWTANRQRDGTVKKRKRKECKPYSRRWNIWKYTVSGGNTTKDKIAHQHPAIFPEKLAEDHILSWTNPNDLVFDPMCGSGTTGKMALLNNRQFIGVDISAEYIAIAKERIGIFANENA